MCFRRPLLFALSSVCIFAVSAALFQLAIADGLWYVSPNGNDFNDCTTPETTCATINEALARVDTGDTILVASGIYTGSDEQVIDLSKSVNLSGGWNVSYTVQVGSSIVNGQNTRRGVFVRDEVAATVDFFTIQNGSTFGHGGGILVGGGHLTLNNVHIANNWASLSGGGIAITGTEDSGITLNNSLIADNTALSDGGGIFNQGALTVTNSTVSTNTTLSGHGGGIANKGALVFDNSTISGNAASNQGGGLFNENRNEITSTADLHNATIANNQAGEHSGGISNRSGTITLQNTILVDNVAAESPNCSGMVGSGGHNLAGDTANCDFSTANGDLVDADAQLVSLRGAPGYHPLQNNSPAIDAGSCVETTRDQRGSFRPIDVDTIENADDGCDIGAYEFSETSVLNIRAFVDGRSRLVLQDRIAYWHHLDFAAPGREVGADEPTILNGIEWFPVWPDIPDPENRDCNCNSASYAGIPALPGGQQTVPVDIIQARERVRIVQQPNLENDYVLIVEFDDNSSGGPDWYEINLEYFDAMIPTALPVIGEPLLSNSMFFLPIVAQ